MGGSSVRCAFCIDKRFSTLKAMLGRTMLTNFLNKQKQHGAVIHSWRKFESQVGRKGIFEH
jgi:hypothetical protein